MLLLGIIAASLVGAVVGLGSAALFHRAQIQAHAEAWREITAERQRLADFWAALTPLERHQHRRHSLTFQQHLALDAAAFVDKLAAAFRPRDWSNR